MPTSKKQGIPNVKGVRLAYMTEWGKRLKQARLAKGLRPVDIAQKVRVSAPTVSQWESGDIKSIEGINLVNLCAYLEVSCTWLMTGKRMTESDPPPPPETLDPPLPHPSDLTGPALFVAVMYSKLPESRVAIVDSLFRDWELAPLPKDSERKRKKKASDEKSRRDRAAL